MCEICVTTSGTKNSEIESGTINFFLIVGSSLNLSAPKTRGGWTPSRHLSKRLKNGSIISGQHEKYLSSSTILAALIFESRSDKFALIQDRTG